GSGHRGEPASRDPLGRGDGTARNPRLPTRQAAVRAGRDQHHQFGGREVSAARRGGAHRWKNHARQEAGVVRTEEEAVAAYHRACDFDSRGEEAAAIPEYERSLALGLPAAERRHALLGLGSSLRNVGRAADGAEVLRAATAEFPQDAPLRAFLALALYSSGE